MSIHEIEDLPEPEFEENDIFQEMEPEVNGHALNYLEGFDHESLKKLAVHFIIKLRSACSISFSTIQTIIRSTSDMFRYAVSSLEQDMLHLMETHGVDINAPDVVNLCKI